MSVLAAPLRLHDVDDVEALARKALDDRLRAWGARLRPSDYEDFLTELIAAAWELAGRYDPERGLSFATHAYRILKLRCADCYRKYFGDTRHGPRPVVLSLDAPRSLRSAGDDLLDSVEDSGRRRDRLDEALASSAGDPAENRSPDLVRILEGRGGGEAGSLEALAEQVPEGSRAGARGAAKKRVRPAIPPLFQEADPPPRCTRCLPVFRKAFLRANNRKPADQRATIEEIEEEALRRSQMVKFRDQWVCPRCSTIAGEPFEHVYPNRAARRAAS